MIRIRATLKQSRRSLLGLAALGLTCLALIVAHGGPGLDHMAGSDDADQMTAVAVSLCLAVIQGGALLVAALGGTAHLRRRATRIVGNDGAAARSIPRPNPPVPAARAGPAVLQVFLR
jgi:hypothetical protein